MFKMWMIVEGIEKKTEIYTVISTE